MQPKKPKSKKAWNRSIPDSILLIRSRANALKPAESLCPTLATVERAISGEARAREIIAAWAFVAPVVVMRGAA